MKIEKNIPVPKGHRCSPKRDYKFHLMDVGDSVLFIGDRLPHCTPYSAAMQYGVRSGKKFTGRSEELGVRIWRVK